MKNPTSIATFQSALAARMVVRRLRDAGFEVTVRFGGGAAPTNVAAVNEYYIHRVVVPFVEAVRALSWCREFDAAEGLLARAIRCPQCGSIRVEFRLGDDAQDEGIPQPAIFQCGGCRSIWAAIPCQASEAKKEEHAAA